jgi:hypothetical protein
MKKNDIKLEDIPCRKCPDYMTRACTIHCPKLMQYGYKTDVRLSDPRKTRRLITDEDEKKLSVDKKEGKRNPHRMRDIQQSKRHEENRYDDISAEEQEESVYERLVSDREDEFVSAPKVLDDFELEVEVEQSKIFKFCEVTLRTEFFAFMECTSIKTIAKLAGYGNDQNLHTKLSRRIKKFMKRILKGKGLLKENPVLSAKIVENITPYRFKRTLKYGDSVL